MSQKFIIWAPVILLCALLCALLFSLESEGLIIGDAPPAQGDWVVDENTTATDERIMLNGSLTVTSDAVLTLNNVTLQVNSTAQDTYSITIESGTTLLANDVEFIRGGAHAFGFKFQADATATLNDTLIEYADAVTAKGVILASDNISITNSTIRENDYGLVLRGSAHLSSNLLYNNSVGIYLEEVQAANDIENENGYTGPQGQENSLADIRYTVSRRVQVVNQDQEAVENAQISFNTTGGEKLFGGTSDVDGYSFYQRITIWEVNQTQGNRTLEPYNLSAKKNGVMNYTSVNPSQAGDMLIELDLRPDLVITAFGWGPVSGVAAPSGADNASINRWKILGSDPADWTKLNFDDSSWDEDPAPFGDSGRYNTQWDGDNTAYFRFKFDLPANITILSAQLNTATNDRGAHYVNDQSIYSDLGSGAHGAEYWNAETSFNPDLLNVGGANILASKVENGQNQQFYDAEIEMVFVYNNAEAYKEGRLLLKGEQAKLRITVENQGSINAQDIDLELELEGQPYTIRNFDLGAGNTRSFNIDWEPEEAGNQTFVATVDPADDHDEYFEDNNEYSVTILIGNFGGQFHDPGLIEMPFNETRAIEVNFTNIGDVKDTFDLHLTGEPSGWDIDLSHSQVTLEPGETINLTLFIEAEQGAAVGDYPILLEANSSFEEDREHIVVEAGRYNATEYAYKVYSDEAQIPEYWYAKNFSDSAWDVGPAPFADREDDGIQPGTTWDQDGTWLPIRRWFDMPTNFDWDEAVLNHAFNNYVTPYLNDVQISTRVGGGFHGMNYWNGDGYFVISKSALETDEQNLLSVLGQDGGGGGNNRQWLDLELKLVKRGRGTNQDVTINILPTRDFEQTGRQLETEHLSNSTFTYDIAYHSYANVDQDVDFKLTVTGSQGNWVADLNVVQTTIPEDSPFTLQVEVTADEDIFRDDYLNLTIKAIPDEIPWQSTLYYFNLTAVMFDDGLAPITRVLPQPEWILSDSVTLEWEILNGTEDTLFYHIYYQTFDPDQNKSNWTLWNTYSVETTSDNFTVQDGYRYRFYSLGEDHSYRIEPEKSGNFDTWFLVDLVAPASELEIDDLEGATSGTVNNTRFRLSWTNLSGTDDVDSYSVFYRVQPHGGTFGDWMVVEDINHTSSTSKFFDGLDKMTYQFASVAHDVAGWNEELTVHDAEITIDASASQAWLARVSPTSQLQSVKLSFTYDDLADTEKVFLEHASYTRSYLPGNLAWQTLKTYSSPALPANDTITGLEGDRYHLFRLATRDPLWNELSRDQYVEQYQGNATDGQVFALTYLIEPAPDQIYTHIDVKVDDDGDGIADRGLSHKWELPLTTSMQYYVDYAGGRIVFGDGAAGFKPLNTTTVMVTYDAYDTGLYIDLTRPISYLYYDQTPVPVETEFITSDLDLPLGWRPVQTPDIASYTIQVRSGDTVAALGAWGPISGWTGLTITKDTYTAQPDKVFQFRSLATDTSGWVETKSDYDLQITVDKTVPGVPGAFTIHEKSVTFNFLNLSWGASNSDDVVEYRLEWSKSETGPFNDSKVIKAPADGSDQVNYIVRALDRQATYYFRVMAIDHADQESPASKALKVTMSEKKDDGGSSVLPIIIILLLVIVLAGGGYYYTQVYNAEKPPMPPEAPTPVGEETETKTEPTAAEPEVVAVEPKVEAIEPETKVKAVEPEVVAAAVETASLEGDKEAEPSQEKAEPDDPEAQVSEFTCPDCGTVFATVPGADEQTCPGCGSTH